MLIKRNWFLIVLIIVILAMIFITSSCKENEEEFPIKKEQIFLKTELCPICEENYAKEDECCQTCRDTKEKESLRQQKKDCKKEIEVSTRKATFYEEKKEGRQFCSFDCPECDKEILAEKLYNRR